MHIDREEHLVRALDWLPHSNQRLPCSFEIGIVVSDSAWVILDGGTVHHGILISARARIGLVQLHYVRTIQVRAANIAAWLAAVEAIYRSDFHKAILYTGLCLDALRERGESDVGGRDAVVGRARVILDFLEEDEVWGVEFGDDLVNDAGHVCRVGGEVLGVVVCDGETFAVAGAGE